MKLHTHKSHNIKMSETERTRTMHAIEDALTIIASRYFGNVGKVSAENEGAAVDTLGKLFGELYGSQDPIDHLIYDIENSLKGKI